MPEVVALARALAHPREHRVPGMVLGDVVDQFLDGHGLANPGAAEEADLTALGEGSDQVDDLDAGFEDLDGRRLVGEGRRSTMDRQRLATRQVPDVVDGWPSTLNSRPSVCSPTGTEIG